MSLKNLKRAFSIAMAAMMVTPTGVFAEEPDAVGTYTTTSATIDYSQKGSITLYKYLDNNGKTVDASGVSYTENKNDMLGVIRDYVGDDEILPEAGVKFKAVKVADIEQVTENTVSGESVTGTYYTNIDSGFFEIMNDYLGEDDALTASKNTKSTDGRQNNSTSEVDDHYETDEFNEKLQTVNRKTGSPTVLNGGVTGEVALNRYLRQMNNAISFDATDEQGYTKIDNLEVGLYLVCEVDYNHQALSKHDTYWERMDDGITDMLTGDQGDTEDAGTENSGLTAGGTSAGGSQYADIASPSSPFLVGIPMTNLTTITGNDGQTHEAGTVWQYDVVAYPKAGSVNIHKDIVLNDYAGLTNGGNEDGLIGVDGNDVSSDKTLCNMVQTNYTASETKLDGSQKSGLTHQIDANIGDTITQLVSADVPRLTDDIDNEQTIANSETVTRKHNAFYIISDRMTKGLQLVGADSFKVTLSSGAWNDYGNDTITFVAGEDYSLLISDDKQSYTLRITGNGLRKMDNIYEASYLYVLYDCKLTKDALIGTDTYSNQRVTSKTSADSEDELIADATKEDKTYYNENGVSHPEAVNQNTAKLTYATDRTQQHDYYSNTTKVYTYELDLTKIFSEGTKGYVSKSDTNESKTSASFDYSAVKFTVKGSVKAGSEDAEAAGGNQEDIIFIRVDDGVYRVWDKQTDGGDYDSASDVITQAAADKTITKFVTPNSQSGLLRLIGVDARTYEFTEVATAKGRNLMSYTFFVELVAPVVEEKTLENGSIEHAYVYTGSRPSDISKYDLISNTVASQRLAEGRVPFTVQNNEVIVLKTGDKGIYICVGAGCGLAVLGLVCYKLKKKNEEDESTPTAE